MDKSKRLASLDALRGFDMMFIMGVAGLIVSICRLFPDGNNFWLAQQMGHVDWNGLRHHDTIFPLFIFLAGVSWPFSLSRQREAGKSTGQIVWKIIRRCLILIALGLVYNGIFRLDFKTLRVASVLMRIGIAWAGAALIYLFVKSGDPLSLQGNLVGWVDRKLLLGRLLYDGGRFDPEGLLSAVPAIVTAMLGMFAGDLVRLPDEKMSGGRKALWLLAAAVVCGVLAWAWSFDFPINKKLWTSSFVLAVGSYSFACFAIFYYIIDVKGWKKWAFPLQVIGMNSITIYLLQRIVSISSINNFFFGGLAGLCGDAWGKVIISAGYVLVCWLILYFLYKKDVFLKV